MRKKGHKACIIEMVTKHVSVSLSLIDRFRLKYLFGPNFRLLFSNRSQFLCCAQIGPNFCQFDSIRF